MSRRLIAAVGAAALVVVLAGCGIPDQTAVAVDGQGPPPGLASGWDSGQRPPTRLAAQETEMFVLNFLKAAAGETGARAVEQIRNFVAPQNREQVKVPKPEVALNVVRLRERPQITGAGAGADEVTLRVQQLGVLKPNGAVEPPEVAAAEYTFTVGSVEGETGRFVLNPPPILLLSEDALSTFYLQRTIYFWDLEQRLLVPDLRYLPLAVPLERRRNELLQALLAGPSTWINKVVQAMPAGTKGVRNVPDTSDVLKISLTADAAPSGDPRQLERLAAQLMWSLWPDFGKSIELTIEGQNPKTFRGADLLVANPAHELAQTPERFCVYQGQVRRLHSSGRAGDPVPLLTAAVNRNIVSAGLTRDGDVTSVALVVQQGQRRQIVVGSGTAQGVASFRPLNGTFAAVGRPVWLKGPGTIGLVPADGRLYQFQPGSAALTPVALPGATGAVTAVGVAPDGHRIVVVAGGRLYVAALTRGDLVEAEPARPLPTSLRNLTTADWATENTVVVAGRNSENRWVLYDITVDGVIETRPLRDLGTASVGHLAAYPGSPVGGGAVGARMYVANGIAYDLFGPGEEIRAEEIIGVGAAATPGPTARSSGASAPFFLY
ncbi:LpqB family beta-propeller domain-containing protein [Micromonospora sp. NPDC049679]|uniref:LpqB family beta-propeller domain-containing protein n=1 Tax=Micromonospora sp. NPDC049679 TaxID=3155920 RepID=UPI0033CCDB8F